jgi:hypothetical protein
MSPPGAAFRVCPITILRRSDIKMKKQAKDKKSVKTKKGKEQIEGMGRTAEKSSSPASVAKKPGETSVSAGPVVPRAEGKLAARNQPGRQSAVPVKPSEEKPFAGKGPATGKAPHAGSPAAANPPRSSAASKETEAPGIRKEYSQSRDRCRVTFRLPAAAAPTAKKVMVVGDFNGWNREATPMKKQENGDFAVAFDLRAGREYRFRYFIDGQRWENDWRADKYIMSPYGDEDSVVCV